VKDYYKLASTKTAVMERNIYDGSHVRLRELALQYSLKIKRAQHTHHLDLSLIGYNLLFLYKPAPFDPELVAGVHPAGVGVDIFGLPAYRSLGLSLRYKLR
jgi:hypothetical protein